MLDDALVFGDLRLEVGPLVGRIRLFFLREFQPEEVVVERREKRIVGLALEVVVFLERERRDVDDAGVGIVAFVLVVVPFEIEPRIEATVPNVEREAFDGRVELVVDVLVGVVDVHTFLDAGAGTHLLGVEPPKFSWVASVRTTSVSESSISWSNASRETVNGFVRVSGNS